MAFLGTSPRETNWAEIKDFVKYHHDTYDEILPKNFNLAGKSVFVSGASMGIGKATAVRYAAAGCSKIAIGARSPLEDVKKAVMAAAAEAGHPEPTVVVLSLDVTSEESVKAASQVVAEAFGGSLDVLVANAGYNTPWRPIDESDPTEWWKTLDTNLLGLHLCSRSFIPLLLKSDTKLLLALSSIAALRVDCGAGAYAIAKVATCRFVEFADQEYHTKGLIAIAIQPGAVKTDLALKLPDFLHPLLVDTPELPADNFLWLTAERRTWLSGRFICSNWDVTELEGRKEEIVEKNLLKFKMHF
ncbi:hypothetical protein QBC38DRAFT_530279 [Podospora fimiseda]|uniref:Oxidoreductase n=1 Tax=Podospora fimiseda TaxID=252190 RepID=A0AAN7GVJ9_9PEZI|nr:hypothetical protein QBC38DRAFT_530279 [Podospora fimiseda]